MERKIIYNLQENDELLAYNMYVKLSDFLKQGGDLKEISQDDLFLVSQSRAASANFISAVLSLGFNFEEIPVYIVNSVCGAKWSILELVSDLLNKKHYKLTDFPNSMFYRIYNTKASIDFAKMILSAGYEVSDIPDIIIKGIALYPFTSFQLVEFIDDLIRKKKENVNIKNIPPEIIKSILRTGELSLYTLCLNEEMQYYYKDLIDKVLKTTQYAKVWANKLVDWGIEIPQEVLIAVSRSARDSWFLAQVYMTILNKRPPYILENVILKSKYKRLYINTFTSFKITRQYK